MKGQLYKCMICKTIICSFICTKKSSNLKGNLNLHANHVHQGKTAFLNLSNSLVILSNYPKFISYGFLYVERNGLVPSIG